MSLYELAYQCTKFYAPTVYAIIRFTEIVYMYVAATLRRHARSTYGNSQSCVNKWVRFFRGHANVHVLSLVLLGCSPVKLHFCVSGSVESKIFIIL